MFGALEVFYENALYKSTFDIFNEDNPVTAKLPRLYQFINYRTSDISLLPGVCLACCFVVRLWFVWQAGELERVEKEINIKLHGIGLSLVNDKQRKEVAYMAISRFDQLIIRCLFTDKEVAE